MPFDPRLESLHPPKWEVFDEHASFMGAKAFDFSASVGDVNRFAARYRLARSLRSLNLEGYSSSIAAGYTSLFRLLLVWSSFEFFLKVIGIDKKSASRILNEEERAALVAAVRAADPDYRIVGFVRQKTTNRTYVEQLDQCMANKPFDPLCLVPSIRHLFAHGELASSSGAGESQAMTLLCDKLTDAIFLVIDREFERRMTDFEEWQISCIPSDI